jgi:hypothetical protein
LVKKKKRSNQNICNAGEFYIAQILSLNDFTTTITYGRAEKYDILTVDKKGNTFKLQVKTTMYGDDWWMVNKKTTKSEKKLFYAFVQFHHLKKQPEFWLVPSKLVASFVKRHYKKKLATPKRDGTKRKKDVWGLHVFYTKPNKWVKNWNVDKYKNNIRALKKS